jgi:hypothetical protein
MEKHLKQKHDELREKMRKYDEAILKLINQWHKDIIVQTITDYLSQFE